MPDMKNHAVNYLGLVTGTQLGAVQLPHLQITGQLIDSVHGTLIFDYSGANVIDFTVRVVGASVQDHEDLANYVANWLVQRKAGLI